MQLFRQLGSIVLLGSISLAPAAELYYSQAGLLYQYNTVTNTIGPAFGSGYEVDQYVGFQTGGLEVGRDGTVYAEAMVGGTFGTHEFQKFNGATGAYLGGINDPTLGNESPTMGPDGLLYMSAALPIQNGGGVDNGLQRIDPATGANLGNLIQPGFNTNLYLIPSPMWLPNGDLLITDGDNQTIKRFNPTTGAYEGVFASVSGYQLGSMAYFDGDVYVGDYGDQQVLKFRASDGAFLGDALTGPLEGYTGRIEIADGELFAEQRDTSTFEFNINRYNLTTGALEVQLNLGGPIDNFAIASQVAAVPEPAAICGLGVGLFAVRRRRRSAA